MPSFLFFGNSSSGLPYPEALLWETREIELSKLDRVKSRVASPAEKAMGDGIALRQWQRVWGVHRVRW